MATALVALSILLLLPTVAVAVAPGWETCGGLGDSYNNTGCPADSATCCKQLWAPGPGTWGCCPGANAVCCSNGYTCCPSGYTCQDQGSGWGVVTTCVPPAGSVEPEVLGNQVCKQGPPLPFSTTQKNVLIIGDSVSIGYTPFVADLLSDVAFVQHSPWGGDGGAEETKYGWQCIEYLLRAPDGTVLVPDVIMFNWGLHNCLSGNSTIPGQGGPPWEYAPYLALITGRLSQLGSKLLFAITSPDLCDKAIDDVCVGLSAQAETIMAQYGIPTVSLYKAIVEKCGPVPTQSCFGESGCFCPHCVPAGYSWLANSTIAPAIRQLL